jgi:HK97 gp10 family phage protein
VSVEVRGLKDLQQQLLELGAELAQKTLAKAARKAFLPVLNAAIAKVPVDTGLTRDNIKITVAKPKKGDSVVVVGLRIAKAAPRQRADGSMAKSPDFRWHFIELGVAAHGIAARPFLRPALDENADQVVSSLKEELEKAISQALKKRAGGRSK